MTMQSVGTIIPVQNSLSNIHTCLVVNFNIYSFLSSCFSELWTRHRGQALFSGVCVPEVQGRRLSFVLTIHHHLPVPLLLEGRVLPPGKRHGLPGSCCGRLLCSLLSNGMRPSSQNSLSTVWKLGQLLAYTQSEEQCFLSKKNVYVEVCVCLWYSCNGNREKGRAWLLYQLARWNTLPPISHVLAVR